MNTPSNDVPASPLDTPAIAPAAMSATRPLYWSVRRELWENRSLYVAPLAAAVMVLFGSAIRALTLPSRLRSLPALDAARQDAVLFAPFSIAASIIVVTAYIVGVFYCVDALHGERRDRSILFWKSLPVSDLTTVLSKASIPLVVLPGLALAIAVATQLAMLLLSTVVLLASGLGVATLWTRVFEMTPVLVYGLAVHVLWHAPLWAWLLLVSSWARRTPFLWAMLPPLALGVVERMAFQTSHFGSFVRYRVMGAMARAFVLEPGNKGHVIRLAQLDPLRFLGTPGLWIGLAAAALFLGMAVRMRRRGEPL
jgi:ABC-2 type transport system permease protein